MNLLFDDWAAHYAVIDKVVIFEAKMGASRDADNEAGEHFVAVLKEDLVANAKIVLRLFDGVDERLVSAVQVKGG